MPGVKLSDIINALHQDDEMRKLATDAATVPNAPGGNTQTQDETPRMVGESVEDEKAKIQNKLMEMAGLQQEQGSAAKTDETLNVAQTAPVGEAAQPTAVAVNPAASAAAAPSVAPAAPATAVTPGQHAAANTKAAAIADTVAAALSKQDEETRKEACKGIISKIAQMNALSLDDIKDEKVASAKFAEYDAAGRIMARAYHDEINKLAAEAVNSEEGTPAAEETPSTELSNEDKSLIEELAAA